MVEKDYRYVIGILVLIIVVIFTFHYGGKDSEMVSYFSFAGTLTSIILSALAIGYTYMQNSTSVNQFQKLGEISDRFQLVAKEFESASLQMATSLQCVDTLGEQVSSVDKNVVMIHEQMRGMGSAETNGNKSFTKLEIEKTVESVSISGMILLFLCTYEFQYPKGKSFVDLLDELRKFYQITEFDYAHGFLIGYSCTGIINLSNLSEGTLAVEIPQNDLFEVVLNEEIERRILSKEHGEYTHLLTEGIEGAKALYAKSIV